MKILSKRVIICLITVLITGLIINIIFPSKSLAIENNPIDNSFRTVSYQFNDTVSDGIIKAYFEYSDSLFLLNSRELNGDLAKMGIGLSSAAYSFSNIMNVLGSSGMGFTCNNIGKAQQAYDYVNSMTYGKNDLDYVAYSIWHKVIGDKIVYCVPIKGTSKNAEWYSNFNLGTGSDHIGFSKAARRVLIDIEAELTSDSFDDNHTIVFTTGHSRGAAVSNIVAAELNSVLSANNVISYNYAVPAVSLNANTSLRNIYNFNNPGDLVPLLPLESWGYKRNGITITTCPSVEYKDNTYFQFNRLTKKSCVSADNPDAYLSAINLFLSSPDDFNSDKYQFIFRIVALYMGGGLERNEWSAICSVDGYNGAIRALKEIPKDVLDLRLRICLSQEGYYQEAISFIESNETDVSSMSNDQFEAFKIKNLVMIKKIETYIGYSINTTNQFVDAKYIISDLMQYTYDFVDESTRVFDLFFKDGASPADSVAHGHDQAYYIAWINSLYFGDHGWSGNTSDLEFIQSDSLSISSIGNSCFSGCKNLQRIVFNVHLMRIGNNAFTDCKGISKVTIPESVTSIGYSAFASCSGITELTIPCSTECEVYKDNYSSDVRWPFGGCIGISVVNIIGQGSIMDYNNISRHEAYYCYAPWHDSKAEDLTINIGEGITRIGDYAFYGKTNLKNLSLPSTVTSIGEYSYYGCSGITEELKLPSGLTSIGSSAFSGCSGITGEFNLPSGLTSIGSSAFNGCSGITGELKIPDGTKTIAISTFAGCKGISKVTIPESVTSIGYSAFASCSGITELTIPCSTECEVYKDNYSSDVRWPFGGCIGISVVNIIGQGSIMDYNNISRHEAYYCYAPWHDSKAEDLTINIGEGITRIGDYAFYGKTNLKNLSLPSTVTSIGEYAFYNCNRIANIYYDGSIFDWNKIKISSYNSVLTSANIHYAYYGLALAEIENGMAYLSIYRGKGGEEVTVNAIPDLGYELEDITVNGASISGNKFTMPNEDVTVDVIFKPTITIVLQPSNYLGTVGSTAKFSVTAVGNNLTYQWQLKKGSSWAALSSGGAKTNSMSIKVDDTKNGKVYRCLIIDSFGNQIASNEVKITVTEPTNAITIKSQPSNYVGPVGSSAKFTVSAEGSGLKYQWQLKKGSSWANLSTGGATTSTMTIKVDESKNGKVYRCIITDANGEELATESVNITVKNPSIVINSQPSNYVGLAGSTAKFTVSAEGSGLQYQWQLKKGSKWANLSTGGATTSTMTIKVDDSKNGKVYRCLITSADGEELATESVSITVKQPTNAIVIDTQPTDYSGEVGTTAKFSVAAQGNGLTYQWQLKKGKSWSNLTSGGATTSTMSIKVDSSKDGKTYRCVITDSEGNELATEEVTIHVVTPVASTVPSVAAVASNDDPVVTEPEIETPVSDEIA